MAWSCIKKHVINFRNKYVYNKKDDSSNLYRIKMILKEGNV